MITEASWEEFGAAGLFWWVNRGLHLFGWALVREVADPETSAERIVRVYPARCKFRGFGQDVEEDGFRRLSEHLRENAGRNADEAKE